MNAVAKRGYVNAGGWLHNSPVIVVKIMSGDENLQVTSMLEPEQIEGLNDDAFEFCVVRSGMFPVTQPIAAKLGYPSGTAIMSCKALE